jgi:hypothetical protein
MVFAERLVGDAVIGAYVSGGRCGERDRAAKDKDERKDKRQ